MSGDRRSTRYSRKRKAWPRVRITSAVEGETRNEKYTYQNESAEDTIKMHLRLKVQAIAYFGDVSLRSLTVDEISRFRESWEFAPLTTRNTIERFRAFFNICMAREWIEKPDLANGGALAPLTIRDR
jgi:hypothetical protein